MKHGVLSMCLGWSAEVHGLPHDSIDWHWVRQLRWLQGQPQHCHQAPDACVQGSSKLLHGGSPVPHINSGHIALPDSAKELDLSAAFTCIQALTAGLLDKGHRSRTQQPEVPLTVCLLPSDGHTAGPLAPSGRQR